jgi:hypothetical protein|tara:strand:- start:676 stop:777 length:102 start_codon:yes stop_codon:yes gene_type:complete
MPNEGGEEQRQEQNKQKRDQRNGNDIRGEKQEI